MNMYRVRGHLIADLDPLSWKEPRTHPELDPAKIGRASCRERVYVLV